METINGVAIPGQWLTRDYIISHQIDGPTRLKEPRINTCKKCGELWLPLKGHECMAGVDMAAHRAALPWRKGR